MPSEFRLPALGADMDEGTILEWHVAPGARVTAGERIGLIRFGSRVDVYLPLTAQPRVSLGDKVYATENILAELV